MLRNMFRKKQASGQAVDNNAGSYEQVSQGIVCQQCGLNITEPDAIRCPRCFTLVIKHQCGGCGKCSR